jgi:hypothetical protein
MVVVGIVSQSTAAQCVNRELLVNDRPVVIQGGETLLQLLRRHVTVQRVALADAVERQPLAVLDGVALHGGITRLNDIPLEDVLRIVVLRPRDAMTTFGSRGMHGAVVVVTKSGCKSGRAR